jgi:hypothetical protein
MKFTKQNIPEGSILGWVSDVHIPIHHDAALRLMCEAWEAIGVTHVIAGGDILDLHCLSSHDRDPARSLEHGTLRAEVEPGRWFLNFLATRPSVMLTGNHETRLDRFLARPENAALYDNPSVGLRDLVGIPSTIELLPDGEELHLGNLVFTHGHNEFKKGTGGPNPAKKMLDMAPDWSTMFGHLHRAGTAWRTSRDEDGVPRTRMAYAMGHMSLEEQHYSYVSRHPNWQMGFGVVSVWWEGCRPRWNVDQVEVMFNRRGRPYFSLWGRVYR